MKTLHGNIRCYRESDFSKISEIYSLSKLDELSNENTQFQLIPLLEDSKRYPLFLESHKVVYELTQAPIDDRKQQSPLTYKNQDVVAYAAFFRSEIRSLYVHPMFRKHGIARQLLQHAIDNIEGDVHLHVASSNKPAITLYAAAGFEIIASFSGEYGGKPVAVHTMQRRR